jgi:hypothetical protein
VTQRAEDGFALRVENAFLRANEDRGLQVSTTSGSER